MTPKIAALAVCLSVLVPTNALSEPSARDAISPTKAGRFFASICFNIYPDVAKAQSVVQRKGFRYDPKTKLFENARKDQRMRINGERCSFQFLTKDRPPKLGAMFAEASTAAGKNLPDGLHVQIDVELLNNGLSRASAKIDRQ